jgi:hypothetical protein
MNQRRKRLSRAIRDLARVLTNCFEQDCKECFENSVCCRHPHFFNFGGCEDEGDSCEDCPHFTGLCNPSSICPGSQDGIQAARDIIKGHPFEIVHFKF